MENKILTIDFLKTNMMKTNKYNGNRQINLSTSFFLILICTAPRPANVSITIFLFDSFDSIIEIYKSTIRVHDLDVFC